jgi:hypothetical protein
MGGKTDFNRICIAFTQNPSGSTVHHMEQNKVQTGSKETSNAITIYTRMTLKAKALTPWSRVHLKRPVVKEEGCFII